MTTWPAWDNPRVELFHGTIQPFATSIAVDGIDINRGQPGSDFGPGFYTTTWRSQAEVWAQIVAAEKAMEPAVVRVTLDRHTLRLFKHLAFIRGDTTAVDYWSFVYHCRYRVGAAPITGDVYDVVYGPFAVPLGDRVVPGWDQISFHGPTAQKLLLDRNICSIEVMPWPS
jgi:Protein of unknown function (DUF3990)